MSVQYKASNRARRVVASLLVPTETPFKDYLKAADYCTAIMLYTDRPADYEYMVQWRAAFAALMVAGPDERRRLLKRLREDFKQGHSPLPSLQPETPTASN
ncbi:hypothetical protein [Thermochromatium tepidum]|jgi:hypothetical protein|uniref:Uncharacterized protein n=1 Tax=Thermochromatium tepidum ATCC 43061 TaxID=316276 RepID=A0A6I6DX48_THETI|nr:hypothetical protein [Thermochromatium tepidum]QGU32121.1 hypothetical protein E6P07_03415 [Thermochromatium tepidum ATCC 43061]